jgi:hypothetical protein
MPLLKLGMIVQHLGLALLIGGLLALGAFTAPVLFKQFDRDAAGQAMTIIFRRYDAVLMAGAVMVMAGEVVRIMLTGPGCGPSTLGLVRTGVAVLLTALVTWTTFSTNKTLTQLYSTQQQHTPAFHAAHKQSEGLAKTQLLLGVVVLVLSVVSL